MTIKSYQHYVDRLAKDHTKIDMEEIARELGIANPETLPLRTLLTEIRDRVEALRDVVEIPSSGEQINTTDIAKDVLKMIGPDLDKAISSAIARFEEKGQKALDDHAKVITNIISNAQNSAKSLNPDTIAESVIKRIAIVSGKTTEVSGDVPGVGVHNPVEVSVEVLEMLANAVPPVNKTYIDPHKKFGDRLEAMSRATSANYNVVLRGPTGAGKTTWAEQFAAVNNRPCFILDCGTLVEPDQFFGNWSAHAGTTVFESSDLMRWIQQPFAVIVLDEMNRSAHPKVNNALISMLDWRRYVDTPAGRVKVAPGVIFIATLNEGATYVGTDRTDTAIEGRFTRSLNITYMPAHLERKIIMDNTGCPQETASDIIKLAKHLRGNHDAISPRTLIATAEEIQFGATFREAIEITFGGIVGDEAEVNRAIDMVFKDGKYKA